MIKYCENCGRSIQKNDRFCTSCGKPIEAKTESTFVENTNSSSERWWYRLLKVVYILLYVIGLGTIVMISYSTIPSKTLDGELSTIQCSNGKNYAPEKNSIYLYGDTLSYYDDQHARILCEYDTTSYYSSSYTAPSYKNYTFIPRYNYPDFGSWFWYSLLALFVVWTLMKLIRIGVQYVVFGNKPLWKREFKKVY